jgi:chitodextrinase
MEKPVYARGARCAFTLFFDRTRNPLGDRARGALGPRLLALYALILALVLAAALPLRARAAVTGSAKFIPTFIVYYGGGPGLVAGDEQKLARYDLIDIDRWRYSALAPTTWAAVKALNPNVQIYLYEMGPEVSTQLDNTPQLYLNALGRYNVSRGHSMGSLNGNNPGLFLLNSSGARIYSAPYSSPSTGQYSYLMDFGSVAYQSYWVEAVQADIASQPWVADGVFADNCLALAYGGSYSAVSAKYPSNAAWSSAMNSFVTGIAGGLRGFGQKLWCNRGETRFADGAAAWLALDASGSAPDVLLEEGVFAVKWGPNPVWFHQESEWKRQVDTMGAIRNSRVAMMSHTKLFPGQSGTDNWGKLADYWQILWYSLGSFLLTRSDLGNHYFMFNDGTGYNRLYWYDEYEKIDLGNPVAPYGVTTVGSARVYWREFEKGYVYVNPTPYDAAMVMLPTASRQLTHDNLGAALDTIASVTQIALNSHHAAILVKADVGSMFDTQAPTVPTGLTGTALSPTEIKLTWNPSTDNVGVVGYYVYLNDAPLATTTATSFTHSGLTQGTTYNYRVSAYDAVPNHSAWTAPVSVKTPVPDTQAPSVPTGLTGSAVSSTEIKLTWNPSTDNVGVTGYYVYLNDAPLATTTSTSFTHSGLKVGTTYNYRVSAYDAVPNHSAWTSPVSVTLADTQAPTVPTGLSASAVSSTEIKLTWNASTDNVAVTGYYVYLNDQPLATTTSTSFTHSGLKAGTTYSYRVSAYDAVPNHSAWTSPVSVTIADTQAPSVPTGLTGAAISSTEIRLTWNASTDNVGVSGYYVYLNDAPLATATSTSFTHSGLKAGTTYNYRVSAYDAVPNHSAWTSPVAVTMPDMTAPSVVITSPQDGARISGTITISASASDNIGVVGVQFKYNGINLGAEDTAAPYSVTAYTKSVPNGWYTLTAVARDAAGNVTTSAPITVRVWN